MAVKIIEVNGLGGGSGGAWGPESVGALGVGIPGTLRHEIYAIRDSTKDTISNVTQSFTDSAKGAFSLGSFLKNNWQIVSIGAVALVVLLKD